MAITRNIDAREVLSQIVNDPRYADVMRVPVISFPQIFLAIASLGLFASSTLAYFNHLVPLWAAMIFNFIAVYMSFTPLHDASHRAVSSNGFLNDFIGVITGQLLLPAVNMTAFRAIHMDHHRYTGQQGRDPDTAFVKPPAPFGLFYLMFADVHWVFWFLRYGRHYWSRKVALSIGTLLVLMVAVHAAFLLSPWWKEFLLLYVVPQRIGLGFVAYTFAHIQHPHGLTWENEPFQSTVFVRGNSPLRRLMFGQEEHIIHHLTPHVPWFKYKRVWDLANATLTKQGIPSRGWFQGADLSVRPASSRDVIAMSVASIQDSATGVRVITLQAEDGRALLPAEAGAHVDIHLPSGLTRQYSLVEASPAHYLIAVKRVEASRGGSAAMHSLSVGDVVMVGKPRNNFVLYEHEQKFVLVAGGIGITPLLPMAKRLIELRKPFEMHVCARDVASVPFAAELRSLPLAKYCTIHLDQENGSTSLDLEALLATPSEGKMLYICGPQGFMDGIRKTAQAMGWASDAIRTESFGAPLLENTEDKPFTLSLARSRRQIPVSAKETAIDALAKAGIDVPFACMQGTCGTCVTEVLSGSVEHRDAYLQEDEKAENKQMCLCVSRACGATLEINL